MFTFYAPEAIYLENRGHAQRLAHTMPMSGSRFWCCGKFAKGEKRRRHGKRVQIIVKTPVGHHYCSVHPLNHTINKVLSRIERSRCFFRFELGFLRLDSRLFYKGEELTGYRTLFYYGICNDAVLHVKRVQPSVVLRIICPETLRRPRVWFCLPFFPSDTVAHVKTTAHAVAIPWLPPQDQDLRFRGLALQDHHRLEDYDFWAGMVTIKCTQDLRLNYPASQTCG
jgi:hypothetical protein